jgi:selenide,water dikinase
MGPEALAQVVRPLAEIFKPEDYPDLLVGLETGDDAAIYRVSEELAIIFTTDFFTPVVDDPYEYGAIAAVNAMSDVYAMGGEVVLALNICGFPREMPSEIKAEILRGGAEKVADAGGVIAGGHTLDDDEPKYGLALIGFVHPDEFAAKVGARPGDVLFLTKRLGVGIITTAAKGGVAEENHLRAAVEQMLLLNRRAARLMKRVRCHAVTDITGFALIGHSLEMAQLSGVTLRFQIDRLPFLDGAKEYAEEWLFPAGASCNKDAYEGHVTFSSEIPDEVRMLLFTPETSGGLLICVDLRDAETLAALFSEQGQEYWIVGEAAEGPGAIEII